MHICLTLIALFTLAYFPVDSCTKNMDKNKFEELKRLFNQLSSDEKKSIIRAGLLEEQGQSETVLGTNITSKLLEESLPQVEELSELGRSKGLYFGHDISFSVTKERLLKEVKDSFPLVHTVLTSEIPQTFERKPWLIDRSVSNAGHEFFYKNVDLRVKDWLVECVIPQHISSRWQTLKMTSKELLETATNFQTPSEMMSLFTNVIDDMRIVRSHRSLTERLEYLKRIRDQISEQFTDNQGMRHLVEFQWIFESLRGLESKTQDDILALVTESWMQGKLPELEDVQRWITSHALDDNALHVEDTPLYRGKFSYQRLAQLCEQKYNFDNITQGCEASQIEAPPVESQLDIHIEDSSTPNQSMESSSTSTDVHDLKLPSYEEVTSKGKVSKCKECYGLRHSFRKHILPHEYRRTHLLQVYGEKLIPSGSTLKPGANETQKQS